MAEVTIAPAEADERVAVLRLAFRHLPPDARLARVATALDLIDRGELDPAGVLAAHTRGRLVGALVTAPVPGAAAALWPPQAEPGTPDHVADRLLQAATDWLRSQGIFLVQVLLAPEEAGLAAPLLRNGFTHPTSLWYLRHHLDLPAELLGAPEELTFESYAVCDRGLFAATIARTYEQSLDCPEIGGARPIEQVILGHQAGGFDPGRWWLARRGAAPVGVLLLNQAPEGDGWEVAYVGVVPEARRRGHGRELMRQALFEAKAAGQPCLTLSVDARNQPARALYRRLGFESHDRREVFLAVWGPPARGPG